MTGLRRDLEKARAWQRRSKPLKADPDKQREWQRRSKPLKSTTRIKATNPARKKKRYADDFGERGHLVRAQPCLVAAESPCSTPCSGDPVAAHAKSRGAGGNRFDLSRLCWGHHNEQGNIGVQAFNLKYQVDMFADAAHWKTVGDDLGLP